MSKKINMIGLKFGRLTVLSESPERDGQGKVLYKCKCDCGNIISTTGDRLRREWTKSCGCLRIEALIERSKTDNKTHGLSGTTTYKSYGAMISRCNNPNNKKYASYGGRGIKVCERWMQSFENFLEDMGEKPSADLSIERKNNNGDYEPLNCKWADDYEQGNNKSNSTHISYRNELYTVAELARLLDIKYTTMCARTARKHIFIYE